MARYENLPIFRKAEQLTVYLETVVNRHCERSVAIPRERTSALLDPWDRHVAALLAMTERARE